MKLTIIKYAELRVA